jgi:predicted DNA-binding WGR domain protein
MPDERSPIQHHLVLHRRDPEQQIVHFYSLMIERDLYSLMIERDLYSLMIERDLFGTVRLGRNWGRIGTNGRELVEVFGSELEAGRALETVAQAKRRRGYRDL